MLHCYIIRIFRTRFERCSMLRCVKNMAGDVLCCAGKPSACQKRNGGCSNLCIPLTGGSTCACPDFSRLAADNITCISGQFLPRDAMQVQHMPSSCVCLFVCKRRITQIIPYDSRGILVFWCQRSRLYSNGVTPYLGDKCRWGWLKSTGFNR